VRDRALLDQTNGGVYARDASRHEHVRNRHSSKQADQPSTAKNAWHISLPAQSVSVLVPTP
jgi:hypothetical protein